MFRKTHALLAVALLGGAAYAQDAQDAPKALQLTLDDTVRRALENNVDIAVERFNPQDSELAVKELEGVYDTTLSSTLSNNSVTTPGTSALSGGAKVDQKTFTYNFSASQPLRSGATVRLDFLNARTSTDSTLSNFNPRFDSTLNGSLTQPLLRNFKIDSNRYQIRVAKRNQEISDLQFRQIVVNTLANVKQLYYDLLYAIDNLEAQRKSLALATKLLDENRIKVRVGTMAPLDVVAAESEEASREESVILAESAVAAAEDSIKRAIFPQNDPTTWSMRIVPTDRPSADLVKVDSDAAIKAALEKRTDIASARKSLENADLRLRFTRNQQLPQLNLVAGYGSIGAGGTGLTRDGFGGPVIAEIPGGYGDAFGDAFKLSNPTWTLGVNISYNLFNRQASATQARSRVSRDQMLATIRRIELQITAEVRSAARAVETNFKRIESTGAARVLQERRLDAETKKFAAGMSTNFLVTQSQRDLAVAEVAELKAIADYRKSLVDFERVQEVGGGVSTLPSPTTTQ